MPPQLLEAEHRADNDRPDSDCYAISSTLQFSQGEPYQLGWGHFRGDRIALYPYNHDADHSFVDVAWFTYTYASPAMKDQ